MISKHFSAGDRAALAILAFLVLAGVVFNFYRNRKEAVLPSATLSALVLPPSFFVTVEKKTSKARSTMPLDLNRASAKDLENLPTIGPSLAGKIIEYRQKVGRFSRVEELLKVPGIGAKKLSQIKPLVRVLPVEIVQGKS